jgi:hypothetical protein
MAAQEEIKFRWLAHLPINHRAYKNIFQKEKCNQGDYENMIP